MITSYKLTIIVMAKAQYSTYQVYVFLRFAIDLTVFVASTDCQGLVQRSCICDMDKFNTNAQTDILLILLRGMNTLP